MYISIQYKTGDLCSFYHTKTAPYYVLNKLFITSYNIIVYRNSPKKLILKVSVLLYLRDWWINGSSLLGLMQMWLWYSPLILFHNKYKYNWKTSSKILCLLWVNFVLRINVLFHRVILKRLCAHHNIYFIFMLDYYFFFCLLRKQF